MSDSENKPVDWRPDVHAVAETIRPIIERVEGVRQMALQRRRTAVRNSLIATACAVVLAILASLSEGGMPIASMIFVLGLIAAFIIFFVTDGGAIKTYRSIYKREVLAKAAALVAPGISYLPESMVQQSLFNAGGLFNSRIDRYTGEDYFKGRAGATDLLFSELHVERKDTRTDSDGNSSTYWVTVFKGIYLVADFHKDFRCRVKIVPDVAEANFGWLGRKMQSVSGKLVRLSNPEFERAFKVTSDDDVGAHYLLTPDMQERFLALRNRWSGGIRAALVDSCLHLAIPLKENWFETRDGVPATAIEPLKSFLEQLVLVLHITETLDLNTRIWTKS